MRLIVASVVVILGVAMLLPTGAPPAFAQEASPSPSVEPSGSRPDAGITLEPYTEAESFRTWAIVVSGGSASVDVLDVHDFGSGFSVAVLGQSATVTMTLTIPPDMVLGADCVDDDSQVPIGAVVSPNRLVLEVVQGGSYTCRYGSECAQPLPPTAVLLTVPRELFGASQPWALSVAGGRAFSFACTPRPIAALSLVPYPDVAELLVGSFLVEIFGESATVEITAPRPRGGRALVAARCEEQYHLRVLDVFVPPRRLAFDVVPDNSYICDVRGLSGTVPPTDAAADRLPSPSSGAWPMALAVLAGIIGMGLLMVVKRPARRSARS